MIREAIESHIPMMHWSSAVNRYAIDEVIHGATTKKLVPLSPMGQPQHLLLCHEGGDSSKKNTPPFLWKQERLPHEGVDGRQP